MATQAAGNGPHKRKRANGQDVPPWPADRVQRRLVAELVPYARNARLHSPEQVEQIAASIREWGFTMPVLVDESDEVIAGHGRLLAAEQLGLVDVPTMVAAGWTQKQIKAYRLADNQLALNAAWDFKLLAAELGDIEGLEALAGFSADDLVRIMGGHGGLTDPDDAPPLPPEPVTRRGDLWLCGGHRLLCGDATEAGDVALLLNGVKPNLMVTDPPYGVGYDADWRNRAVMVRGEQRGEHGSRAIGTVPHDDRSDWREAWALFPGTVAYVWHGGLHAAIVAASIEASRFKIRSQIVWVKTRPVISRGDYHWQHEPVFYAARPGDDDWQFVEEHALADYAVRTGAAGKFRGGRKQSTVWFIEHVKSETGHSTQKPVECMRRPIANNSSAGQAVYDPFVGSGTTMIAAEIEARVALCLDIDPGYCDVTVQRWQAFTGEVATLESTGEAFDAVAAKGDDAGQRKSAAR